MQDLVPRVLQDAARLGGRRLLSDCAVVGSVGKGGSIAILLLIGFVLGAGCSTLLFWWQKRRQLRIELEYRGRYGSSAQRDFPDVNAMVKAAHTPTIAPSGGGSGGEQAPPCALQLPKAASALAEGPLAMGVASSYKNDSFAQQMSLKEQHNPLAASSASAAGMARSSSGNPFSGEVASFNVRRNEACSLNNTPSPTRPPCGGIGAGLIGAGMYAPAADPASPRMTPTAAGPTATPPAEDSCGWPGLNFGSHPATSAGGVGEQQQQQSGAPPAAPAAAAPAAAHARTESVLVKGPGAGTGAAGAAAAAGPHPAGGGSHYLAALDSAATNPFETPAALQQQQEGGGGNGGGAKAAAKQELLQQVQGEEYGDDDLDPEWAGLLADLDARLQAAGRARLSAKERAVAIRSLIVATSSQSADAALGKAMHDVETFRRAQALRAAA